MSSSCLCAVVGVSREKFCCMCCVVGTGNGSVGRQDNIFTHQTFFGYFNNKVLPIYLCFLLSVLPFSTFLVSHCGEIFPSTGWQSFFAGLIILNLLLLVTIFLSVFSMSDFVGCLLWESL